MLWTANQSLTRDLNEEHMTIVAAVKSRNALVLGADSLTIVNGTSATPYFKVYRNGTKLFQLRDYSVALATYGVGNVGDRSLGDILADYADTLTEPPESMQIAATGLASFIGRFFDETYGTASPEQQPTLGVLVGGIGSASAASELWEIRLPSLSDGNRVALLRGPRDCGANWRGVDIPFARLHFGYDPRLVDGIVALGVERSALLKVLDQYRSPTMFDSMPVEESIAFAEHILQSTIATSTFEPGVPPCGEPVQLAVVLRRNGFQWVHEPRFHV